MSREDLHPGSLMIFLPPCPHMTEKARDLLRGLFCKDTNPIHWFCPHDLITPKTPISKCSHTFEFRFQHTKFREYNQSTACSKRNIKCHRCLQHKMIPSTCISDTKTYKISIYNTCIMHYTHAHNLVYLDIYSTHMLITIILNISLVRFFL